MKSILFKISLFITVFTLIFNPNLVYSEVIWNDLYKISTDKIDFGMEKKITSINMEGNYEVRSHTLQLSSVYGEIDTSEIVINAESNFSHEPVFYNMISHVGEYTHEIYFKFSNNSVNFKFFENDVIQKEETIEIEAGNFILLPTSLPLFLYERYKTKGDSTSILLVSPLTMELTPTEILCAGTIENFLSDDSKFLFKYEVVSGNEEFTFIVSETGQLMQLINNSAKIVTELINDESELNLKPLGRNYEGNIEGEEINLESPEEKDYFLYRITLCKEMSAKLDFRTSFQKLIDVQDVNNVKELLLTAYKSDFPEDGKIILNSENRNFLKSSQYIKVAEDSIIKIASNLTATCKSHSEKIHSINSFLLKNYKLKKSDDLRELENLLNTHSLNSAELAVLFTSIARSSGIPSRVCGGLVYSNAKFKNIIYSEVNIENEWYEITPGSDTFENSPLLIKYIHSEDILKIQKLKSELEDIIETSIIDFRPRVQFSAKEAYTGMKNNEFVDEEYGLKVKIPQDFQIEYTKENTPLKIDFTSIIHKDIKIRYEIFEGLETKAQIDNFINSRKDEISATGVKNITTRDEFLNGYKAIFHVYSTESNNETYSHSHIYINKNDLILEITIMGKNENLKTCWKVIENNILKPELY